MAAKLMSHEDRRRLIEKPFVFTRIQPRCWAGTIINEPMPTKRSVYLEDEEWGGSLGKSGGRHDGQWAPRNIAKRVARGERKS